MSKSLTTTTKGAEAVPLAELRRSPTHPGIIFKTQYREALEPPMSARQTAFRLGISTNHLHGIEKGDRPVSAEMAVKLAALTGASAEFWMTLQMRYDTWHALQAAKGVKRVIPGDPFPTAPHP